MHMNHHYDEIDQSYLFSAVARRAAGFAAEHPEREIIRLSIGDVTRPLAPAVVRAMSAAALEMGEAGTFRGYGPDQGYGFLQQAIAGYYAGRGVDLSCGDIFISDGAKSDLGNLLDLFSTDNTVLLPDPGYPVYADTNVMAGRRVVTMEANAANGFLPMPREGLCGDIVYLCSPGNPTGAVYSRAQLAAWVDWANDRDAILLFDAAYESFITDPALPRSIYEIEGAKTCAIEICSFSKMAGFTGTRCGWTVVPADLCREGMSLGKMWVRRQTTKFNGVAYVVQRGAAAALTPEGLEQGRSNLALYRANARTIAAALEVCGIWYCGGKNSPYIWMKCPGGMDSWTFFDWLLDKAGVIGAPGLGFGPGGEGWFRLTAFGDPAQTRTAARRMKEAILALG